MGSLFGKCCSKKQDVVEIQSQQEIESKVYRNITLNLFLLRMETNEIRLKKKYSGFGGNLNSLINEEVKFYDNIKALTSKNSCIPSASILPSSKDSIVYTCYDKRLLTLIENDSKFLIDIKNNLEKILRRLLEDLQFLSASKYHHLNISPKTIYFSDRFDVKLQNFVNPQFFSRINENNKEKYKNIFFIGKIRNSWQAPEIETDPNLDNEKIDIFAIGKLIELFEPEKNSLLHRLYRQMIMPEASLRPTYSECLSFINAKGDLPRYSIIKNKLNNPDKNVSTDKYDCKIFIYSYFQQLYEITEITVKKPDYMGFINIYMDKMMYLSPNIGCQSCFLHVYETVQEDNTFIIITEYYSNNLFKRLSELSGDFPYTINELWDIFTPLLYGVKEFKEKNIFHGRISTKNLLIDDNNCLKFHGFAFDGIYYVQNQEIRQKLVQKQMIAPELIEITEETTNQADFGKADVYLLGLAWLEVACRVDRRTLKIGRSKKIKRFLDSQENLNTEMKNILMKMLEVKVDKRSDILYCIKFLTESNRV